MRTVYLDLEATGLDRGEDEIVEIGILADNAAFDAGSLGPELEATAEIPCATREFAEVYVGADARMDDDLVVRGGQRPVFVTVHQPELHETGHVRGDVLSEIRLAGPGAKRPLRRDPRVPGFSRVHSG